MSAPIIAVSVLSSYKNNAGQFANLPSRMGRSTPDMQKALIRIGGDLRAAGGAFRLSDLYRSYEMQLQAHMDYKSGKKSAYSPPPGGSMHESGRAFDVDVGALGVSLARFWEIAAKHGVVPIIDQPSTSIKECWHFECRGSHELVRQYYKAGKGKNMKPSEAIAASAIVGTAVEVSRFKDQTGVAIQSALIRLGQEIGDMDGALGPKSNAAITALGITPGEAAAVLAALEAKLAKAFPDEWDTAGASFSAGDFSDDSLFWEDSTAPDYLDGGD